MFYLLAGFLIDNRVDFLFGLSSSHEVKSTSSLFDRVTDRFTGHFTRLADRLPFLSFELCGLSNKNGSSSITHY
jgi:hypothetical protein